VTTAYRRSFFANADACRVATARAGNVIGGGDWARDRLVPDAMRAFSSGTPLRVRNPRAVRPWQHVLNPTLRYLRLAQRLCEDGDAFAGGWNFGPGDSDSLLVGAVVERLVARWGRDARWETEASPQWHPQAPQLRLDSTKSLSLLDWAPLLDIETALTLTVEWYRACRVGADMRAFTLEQTTGRCTAHRDSRPGRRRNTASRPDRRTNDGNASGSAPEPPPRQCTCTQAVGAAPATLSCRERLAVRALSRAGDLGRMVRADRGDVAVIGLGCWKQADPQFDMLATEAVALPFASTEHRGSGLQKDAEWCAYKGP
jgi:hypothetical protein